MTHSFFKVTASTFPELPRLLSIAELPRLTPVRGILLFTRLATQCFRMPEPTTRFLVACQLPSKFLRISTAKVLLCLLLIQRASALALSHAHYLL